MKSRTLRVIVMIIIAMNLFLILTSQNVSAGGTVGNGTPGSCTEATLNSALAGGGTVTFNCGGPKTILVTHIMTITQDTTIQGGGNITITGGLTTLLFHVMGRALTLNDITLDSAYNANGDGGAIVSSGILSLNNVTIQNSQTTSGYCGGAIWTSGAVFISYSTFYKNNGGNGGAICTGSLGTANVQIANSNFNTNKTTSASGLGGAIFVNTGVMTVTDSSFIGNQAQYGGALALNSDAFATLRSTNTSNPTYFLSNYAADSGGAVFNVGTLNVGGVQFNGNTAQNVIASGYGGAIADLGTLYVTDSSFSTNGGRYGGALLVGQTFSISPVNPPHATVDRTDFDHNNAGNFGGALYINSTTAGMTLTNSVLDQNTAASGGGIRHQFGRLDITNSSITNNQATGGDGGGISNYTNNLLNATSVTLSGNTASGNQGGGIYNNGYTVLRNLTLKSNTNGIYIGGAAISTYISNSALDNPGYNNCAVAGPAIVPSGPNLSTDISCGFSINNTPAQLGALTTNNNGVNRTKYHMPLAGSPLINAGAGCPTLDQRGAARPNACDLGAVEYGGLAYRLILPLIVR